MSHRALRLSRWLPAAALVAGAVLALGGRGALAANDPIELKVAEGEVQTLANQVKDKKNIEGLKVGDVVNITFTEALMITVDPPKK